MIAKKAAWAGLVAGSVWSSLAAAQIVTNAPRGQDDEQFFTVSGLGEIRHVENALQTTDSDAEIAEQQWRGSLLVNGQINNGWAFFSSDYELTDRRYTEQEVRDEQLLLGRSSLQLGRDTQRLYASFDHSTQEVAIDPLAGNIAENRATRTILSATLNSVLRLKYGDFLHLWGNVTDIQYDGIETNDASRNDASINDALRKGGGLSYTRAISPLYRAGYTLSSYDIEYQNVDESLTNYRGFLWWQADLRYLDYRIQVGLDHFNRDEETTNAPYLDLSLSWDRGAQVFGISYRNWLTDTSQGNMNSELFNQEVGQDGRLGVIDQYERRDLILSWVHRRPCSGCALSVQLGVESEEYERNIDDSALESFLRAGFSYRMTRSLALSFDTSMSHFDFTEEARLGYTQLRTDLSLDFVNLLRHGQLSAFVGVIGREFESTEDSYTSEYIGLSFGYEFYSLKGK